MQIIRTEKQRENLAKFFWDDAKIALAALIVGPLARPETAEAWVIVLGVLSTLAFAEQPIRLRILRGESPLVVSCPIRTTSISDVEEGNDLYGARR